MTEITETTETTEITETELEELRRVYATAVEVVTENPDLRYWDHYNSRVCMYVRDEQSACVVGRVLFRLGWTIDELKAIEGIFAANAFKHRTSELEGIYGSVIATLFARLSKPSWRFLATMQIKQDNNETWTSALGAAIIAVQNEYGVQL